MMRNTTQEAGDVSPSEIVDLLAKASAEPEIAHGSKTNVPPPAAPEEVALTQSLATVVKMAKRKENNARQASSTTPASPAVSPSSSAFPALTATTATSTT